MTILLTNFNVPESSCKSSWSTKYVGRCSKGYVEAERIGESLFRRGNDGRLKPRTSGAPQTPWLPGPNTPYLTLLPQSWTSKLLLLHALGGHYYGA